MFFNFIKSKNYSDPKKIRDEATKMRVRSLPIECSVQIQDVFNFLPHIEEKPFFVYMDKVIKFIKASEDTPEFKKQLDNITWPLYADYFYEKYTLILMKNKRSSGFMRHMEINMASLPML